MLTKSILAILLAACGVHSNHEATEPPNDLPDKPDTPPEEEGQHFCCEKLNGNGSGNGCITLDKSHLALCDKVLYCGGTYENDKGKVKCFDS